MGKPEEKLDQLLVITRTEKLDNNKIKAGSMLDVTVIICIYCTSTMN